MHTFRKKFLFDHRRSSDTQQLGLALVKTYTESEHILARMKRIYCSLSFLKSKNVSIFLGKFHFGRCEKE